MIVNDAAGRWAGRTGPWVSHTPARSLFELWAESQLRAHIKPQQVPPRRSGRGQLPGFIARRSSESNRQVLIKH